MSELKRALGLSSLCFYAIGMILGAGIYSVIGIAAEQAGKSLWMSFLISSFVAFLTGLSYAELSTMYPKNGAEYNFLKQAFPNQIWFPISIGLTVLLAGSATAATVALAFAGYLEVFFSIQKNLVAFALLVSFTAVNIFGIKQSTWVNILFTLIESGGLILFIGLGFKNVDNIFAPFSASLSMSTFSAAGLVIFAYFGFENIVNLVEESKKPEKDLPKAIILSLVVVTVIYVLVSLSILGLVSTQEVSRSQSPLVDAAKSSSGIASALGAIALFSTANTALVSLVVTSRMLYGMAHKESLPSVFSKILPHRKTPWVAALAILAVSLVLLPLKNIQTIASISSFTTLIAFISVHVALLRLRLTQRNLKRPFKVPFSIKEIAVLPVLGILSCFALLTQFDAKIYFSGSGLFLILIALFYLGKLGAKRQGKANVFTGSFFSKR